MSGIQTKISRPLESEWACVPEIHMLKPNPQGGGILRWCPPLPLMNGIHVLSRRDSLLPLSAPPPPED